jgi:hypothetical protein
MEILFKTIHGSHLYGLAHENSDTDYYTVVSKVKTARAKYNKHSIIDGIDSTVIDFGTWVEQCKSGVPQALEAMFSEKAEIDEIESFRHGFRVGTQVWDRYLRTIKSFALHEDNLFKKKRHALRLACNFQHIRRYGRFNPTLSNSVINDINTIAKYSPESVYTVAKYIAWYDS